MVLVETKKSLGGDADRVAARFQLADLRRLEQEILEVLRPTQILTPDEVRGRHATLNEAIRQDGWPRLGACRGRFVFALDNPGSERLAYLKLHPGLQEALLFVSSPPGQPEAAFILDTLGECLFRKGQLKEAVETQRKALKLAPERQREEMAERLNKFEKALENRKKAAKKKERTT